MGSNMHHVSATAISFWLFSNRPPQERGISRGLGVGLEHPVNYSIFLIWWNHWPLKSLTFDVLLATVGFLPLTKNVVEARRCKPLKFCKLERVQFFTTHHFGWLLLRRLLISNRFFMRVISREELFIIIKTTSRLKRSPFSFRRSFLIFTRDKMKNKCYLGFSH